MFIIIGGLRGSSRIVVARLLAKKTGFHYYNLDEKKLHRGYRDKEGAVHQEVIEPENDDQRISVFEKAIAELPHISKMYPDVIVSDSFHRSKPREFFLPEARKIFKTVVVFWVMSSNAAAEQRFKLRSQQGLITNVPLARERRHEERAEFEPFSEPVMVSFSSDSEVTASALSVFVQKMQAGKILLG